MQSEDDSYIPTEADELPAADIEDAIQSVDKNKSKTEIRHYVAHACRDPHYSSRTMVKKLHVHDAIDLALTTAEWVQINVAMFVRSLRTFVCHRTGHWVRIVETESSTAAN